MILTAVFLLLLSLIFAILEIEIEGKYGWAEKIPTWHKKSKMFSFLASKKPLTGYHFFMLLLLFMLFHFVFFVGLKWSLSLELRIISYFILFLVIEDFLWFVFNPYYRLKKFKKDKIWWHYNSKWIFNLIPLDYIIGIFLSILLMYFSSVASENLQILFEFLYSLSFILILILAISIFLPAPYKKWYYFMRKNNKEN
ncbi:MAG: hypothetical protein QXF88_02695 [Candidatus Aenigmatarchaeota archaeon]